MMRTRLLMSLSAAVMAGIGLVATFLPQELLAGAGVAPDPRGVLLLQASGALYCGSATANWMARGNTIGGIYSRPIALGNFLHFTVAGIALLKALAGGPLDPVLLAATAVYLAFAACFGFVVFSHPIRDAR